MDIEMPDGTIIEGVPDGITKSQLMARYQKVEIPEAKGFLGNVAEDMRKRGATQADIINATNTGEQNALRGAWQSISNQVGAANDIVGQGISSLAKTGFEALPSDTQQGLSEYATRLKSTPMGQVLTEGAQAYGENQAAFERENPNLARDLSGIREVATFGMPGGTGTILKGTVKGTKVVGNLAGGITKEARDAIVKQIRAAPIKTSDDIKAIASGFYKDAETRGGTLKPEFMNQFVDKIESLKPQTEHGQIIIGDTALTGLSERIKALKNKPTSLQAAQEMDEGLGELIDGYVDRTTGKLTKEGKKLFDVQSEFRDMIENASDDMMIGREGFDSWKQGKKLWAASRKMADIERIISRAEMMDNPATGIKTGFRTLYNNPNRMRGYTAKERELIKRAANSGIISDTLRTIMGSRLIPIITGASGGGLGATAAAQAGTMASRGLATRAQLGKAKDITREISKRVKTGE